MLSTIPKLADKAFIIGFLFPVILFLTAFLLLFSNVPWVTNILDQFMNKDNIEKILYISLIIWGLSIVMMMLNNILYQFVEGYRWPVSKLAKLWSRETGLLDKKEARLEELERQWEVAGDQFPEELQSEHDSLLIERVQQFPSEKRLILPTRFGNAIRAFEDYSRSLYGADSIPLWIHLNTVISKEFQAILEDARAQVNCLLNLFVFSVIIVVLSIARLISSIDFSKIFTEHPRVPHFGEVLASESMSFALFALCAAIFGRLVYEVSIERIYAWGELVKAAFDCYLPDLAKKLGYKLPVTGDDQKRFWIAISSRSIFHRSFEPADWPRGDNSKQCSKDNKISAKGQEDVSEEENKEAARGVDGEDVKN